MPEDIADTSRVSSVWSAYGHRFMSTDAPEHEACLTCGAMYALMARADDPTRGEYMTASGEQPAECTGDTSMVHGYPGERHGEGTVDHDCPCVSCDS
jgi:hypothetical protein